MQVRQAWDVVVEVFRRASRHHTLLLAAGVAFTSALALVPAMIAIVAIYGLVASPADVEANLGGLTDALPEAAAELIISELQSLTTTSSTNVTIGLIIGLMASAYAISSAVNSVVIAVRVAHEVESPHNWVQGRIFALKLSVVAVLATAISVWLIVVLPEIADRTQLGGSIETLAAIARWPVVVATSAAGLALLYRAVLHRSNRIATATATAMWVASTYGLSLAYQHIDRLQATFTTLGAVAALLVWLYLSATAVLLGAELGATLSTDTDGGAPQHAAAEHGRDS